MDLLQAWWWGLDNSLLLHFHLCPELFYSPPGGPCLLHTCLAMDLLGCLHLWVTNRLKPGQWPWGQMVEVARSSASSNLLTIGLVPPKSRKILVLWSPLFLSWHRIWLLQLQSRPGSKQTSVLGQRTESPWTGNRLGLSLGDLQLLFRHRVHV